MDTTSKRKKSVEELEDMFLGALGDGAASPDASSPGRSEEGHDGAAASCPLFAFRISDDAMTVLLHAPRAVATSVDEILAALAGKRIVNGIDRTAVMFAVDRFRKGEGLAHDLVIARGQQPLSDWHVTYAFLQQMRTDDGSAVWMSDGVPLYANLRRALQAKTREDLHHAMHGATTRAVRVRELIATARRTGHGRPGKNVYGEPLKTGELPFSAGNNVHFDEQSGEFRSEIYGYVQIDGNKFDVVEPLWVAPDRMAAYFVVVPLLNAGVLPEYAEISALLLRRGIKPRNILKEAIESLCEMLASGQPVASTFKIAAGIDPRPGADAKIEMAFDVGIRAGTVRADGSLDFRERNAIVVASRGDVVATKIMATKGQPGSTVFGVALEAPDGRDQEIEIGKGISAEQRDGRVCYLAAADGNVVFKKNNLSLSDVVTIKGDIDYSTGNVVSKTDIMIAGSVKTAFSVQSSANVQIQGMVEDGVSIVAGGNVTVKGGVVGTEGRVMASGSISVHFLQDSQLVARHDVVIGSYAYNGMVRAGGCITVNKEGGSHAGKVIGGVLTASAGITVFVAGSDANHNTVLSLQPPFEFAAKLREQDEQISEIAAFIAKLLRSLHLDSYDPAELRVLLSKVPPEKKALATKVLVRLSAAIRKKNETEQEKRRLVEQANEQMSHARIKVMERICQGSTIQIGQVRHVVQDDHGPATFRLVDGRIELS